MKLTVGKEYMNMGQFVKLIEVNGTGDNRECIIENRFGDLATVWEDDISPKPPRKVAAMKATAVGMKPPEIHQDIHASIPDHQILLAFTNDSDAVMFSCWWEEYGWPAFKKYSATKPKEPVE